MEKEEKQERIISFLSVTSMGKQKIITIPKSIEEIQPGDLVMIVKITPDILEFLKNMPKKEKFEWVDYKARRRFT